MGSTLVLIFLGLFALAIGQAIVRRLMNPYSDVSFGMLPEELRVEVERILPGFQPRSARITRKGDEARAQGEYLGKEMSIEADFDVSGRLVDFEAEARGARRLAEKIAREELPSLVNQEIERVLGEAVEEFEPKSCATGTADDEAHFEVRGVAAGWKWEIAVSESGRLLEVEREQYRAR